jgi:signal peptidase I
MEPTLHCARPNQGCEANHMDRILVPRFNWFWTPGRGDIVVFHTPPAAQEQCGAGGIFVKRIIGLPGEELRERAGGRIYVEGQRLREPYIRRDRRSADVIRGTWHVPQGKYFMVGDNRGQSCDSRRWGSVPRDDIIGKVVLVYWPLGRIGVP